MNNRIPLVRIGQGLSASSNNKLGGFRLRKAFLAAILMATAHGGSLTAAEYYVDPVNGSMSNPGTAAQPWSTLEAVFAALPYKVFSPGDVIHAKAGYHGVFTIKSPHGNGATIQAAEGETAQIRKLSITGVSGWTINNLDVCPEYLAPGSYDPGVLVNVPASASNITITNCRINHALDTTGWDISDWQNRADGTAISIAAPNSVVSNNTLVNVGFGISVSNTGVHTLVSNNTITDFFNDGLRGLADYGIFEYNVVRNPVGADSNHDDFFQSWSTGINPNTGNSQVGYGVVKGIVVRNNMFLEHQDPASDPLAVECQGIGLFDGMYEDFVIENNLIVTSVVGHAISIYGGLNCRVANNTIVAGKLAVPNDKPRVNILEHKTYDHDGDPATPRIPWPVPASGNIVNNNIVAHPVTITAGAGTESNNLASKDYANLFNDYNNYDFTTNPNSPAIDAGTTAQAPTVDIDGNARTLPYDIGAYEYFEESSVFAYEGFDYDPTGNVSTADDSTEDVGFLGTTWTGSNDIVAPGLSHVGVDAIGNALAFNSNVGSVRNFDMTAFGPDYTVIDGDGVTRLGKPGSTLWVMFLMRVDAADPTGSLTTGLNLNGPASGGITKIRIGDLGTNTNWGISRGGTIGYSATPIVSGETVLAIARLTWVAGGFNDEVDLYINPALGPTPPATPSATLRGMEIGTIHSIQIKGNRNSVIDEIAVAPDWNGF